MNPREFNFNPYRAVFWFVVVTGIAVYGTVFYLITR